jgi:CspA family cold shock protein
MADSGMIKWFSNAKGFGFIVNENGNSDIFVHYSAIAIEGYKTLKAGQLVDYEIQEGEKGLHAINVIPLEQKPQNHK